MCSKRSPRPAGCREYAELSRRHFLGVAAGSLGALAVPAWVPRVAFADSHDSSRDVLVSLFLRGGADGLTLCPPYLEPNYYRLRPTLAVPPPDSSRPERALDLDGRFGLAPALEPLLPAYRGGELAVVHACGLEGATRSHFDAMHHVEVGRGDPPSSLLSGWLGRHLQMTAPTHREGLLRAVGLGFGLQRTLVGGPQALPIPDPASYDVAGPEATLDAWKEAVREMYAAVPDPLASAAHDAFATIDLLRRIDFEGYRPADGAVYPEDDHGRSLRSTAALLKADVGVEAVAIDLGGWDTHDRQGPLDGPMARLMRSFAEGLAAFHRDVEGSGDRRVLVVVMSEFGRNAFENGSLGTDHGHGNLMMVMGGGVRGGRVVTEWPGLENEQLFEGQDLAITIDYRDVLGEILRKRLANPDVARVFDDPTYTPIDRSVLR